MWPPTVVTDVHPLGLCPARALQYAMAPGYYLHTASCTVSACRRLQEKRKRDEGKVKRGGSYVEEEKRRARDYNIFSGFD